MSLTAKAACDGEGRLGICSAVFVDLPRDGADCRHRPSTALASQDGRL